MIRYSRALRAFIITLLLAAGCLEARCQTAVKTNLLYDATTTPNLGVEVGVGNKNTLQVVYGLNPWIFHSDSHGERMAKHWVVMPEWRWWTCSKFNGQFIGIHLMGGQFNASNVNLPIPGFFFSGENLGTGVRDYRYEGYYAGAGVSYGWQWILSHHFNIEAEVGVGYDHVRYKKYPCRKCGSRIKKASTNYAGVTKLGVSLLYLF